MVPTTILTISEPAIMIIILRRRRRDEFMTNRRPIGREREESRGKGKSIYYRPDTEINKDSTKHSPDINNKRSASGHD